ncbi:sulfatase-like hydrolase/transferase [Rufibacter sediminis]|uniref:Sulfatase-like hydrolase/transferase n=1 Tax=Rufibacter sediminis TaxID=2762756 RepID=A0ABR6W018_9BACT|nr:sulfatase-like hydrolase/transferase [Rufibacter sediminis]MBC3542392.1 sulfatase-like hydrolase/transferase [Rufibacter sediminis]
MVFRLSLLFLGVFSSCLSTSPTTPPAVLSASSQQPNHAAYATKNVVLVVIDGVRYSDSWGDSSLANIPRMARELAPKGVFHPQFYNKGVTKTNPGHVALTTGHHQRIQNNGGELPELPSVFHYYRQHTGAPATKAWVITSKDKLEILARTNSTDSAAQFAPATSSGKNGLGTGYRPDTTTIRIAKQVFSQHKPQLVLINLREPDSEAHEGNWDGYIKAIQQSDRLVADLWKWLQKQPGYKNTTTLLVTNDHGRHTGERFEDHGDNCEGCRHISLLVMGPDVKAGTVASKPRSQVDVAATMADLLGVPLPKRDGEPMRELFKTTPVNAD